MRPILISVCLFAALVATGVTAGKARGSVIDYSHQGTFTTPSLTQGGVTVTGSNTISVLNLNGLGIVGGSVDFFVDQSGSESIRFHFDNGPATDVVVYFGAIAGFDTAFTRLEAFSQGGGSLGTRNIDLFDLGGFSLDVSAEFGGGPIGSFTLTPLNTNLDNEETLFIVSALSFEPVAIPEPISLVTFGLLSVCGLLFLRPFVGVYSTRLQLA